MAKKEEHFVSIVGAGKLAMQLAPALDNVGFQVREVYSPHIAHAKILTGKLYEGEVHPTLDFSQSPSRIFILTVTDDAIGEVASQIILPAEAILLHTAGSISITELQRSSTPHIGVFYPLQSFSSKLVDFENTPLFIEGSTEFCNTHITAMAKALSRIVCRLSSQERKQLHLAAVFASNFTNYMLTLAKEITDKNGLEFSWLQPLVYETVSRAMLQDPAASQTGPAARGNLKVLDEHLQLLKDKEAAEIYQVLSQHILDRYNK